MILVDTSVWIRSFLSRPGFRTSRWPRGRAGTNSVVAAWAGSIEERLADLAQELRLAYAPGNT